MEAGNQSQSSGATNNKVIMYVSIALGAIVMITAIQFLIKQDPKKTNAVQKTTVQNESTQINQNKVQPDEPLSEYEQYLVQAANEVNKRCPMMIDKETRLDNAMALPNNEFQYSYTLITTLRNSIDVQTVSDYIRPTLLNMVRTTPDLAAFRQNQTTMSYNYNDKNGVFLFKLSFSPEEYQ